MRTKWKPMTFVAAGALLLLLAMFLALPVNAALPDWADGKPVTITYENLTDTSGDKITVTNIGVATTSNPMEFSRSSANLNMHRYTAHGGSGNSMQVFCIEPGKGFDDQTYNMQDLGNNPAGTLYEKLGQKTIDFDGWDGPASQRMLNLVLQFGVNGERAVGIVARNSPALSLEKRENMCG